MDIEPRVRQFIETHRVARLATADSAGQPSVIPICYALDNNIFYSAIDEKLKRAAASRLQRVRNIMENPKAALLIDDYSEMWDELVYVHIRGQAGIIQPGVHEHHAAIAALRAKYPQYRSMRIEEQPVIKFTPYSIRFWSARPV